MTSQIEAQRIRHLQDEVARDPGSPAFLPLAEVYRKEGRLAVALRLRTLLDPYMRPVKP